VTHANYSSRGRITEPPVYQKKLAMPSSGQISS
jgi:hypothetical protein